MTCNNATNIFLLGLASSMKTDIRTTSIDQQNIMTFAYVFSVTLMVTFGIISNVISIDTFRQTSIRSTTVGIYLLIYSCCSLFGLIMLVCRLFQLIDSLTYLPFFFICNVISGLASIFTRICLWLNGFTAFQRSLLAFEPNYIINKFRSRSIALKQIFCIIILIFLMHIHELICRVTLPDPVAPGKFVCQIKYPNALLILNQIFSTLHIFIPFFLHLLSTCLILTSISRRRALLHRTTYWKQWMKEFHTHSHLFVAPIIAMVCTLPQLVLSLKYSCVDISIKWLLRLNTSANLIIYIPQSITFFLFIYYSEVYFKTFSNESIFGKLLCLKHNTNNIIFPLTATHTQLKNETKLRSKMATNKSNDNKNTRT
ncbi:unnamed protein product [Adineta steineri]|uniref:G-protein coupled receptors family 1 profile domain-containing protein n=1 Tax=Adineta steineri TaxID=433720 RepID=A0A820AZE0_9BILA|nr:unnamed protein product [Adineta steineri]CAF4191014.1 unnamed protein product [Adineta steineri]